MNQRTVPVAAYLLARSTKSVLILVRYPETVVGQLCQEAKDAVKESPTAVRVINSCNEHTWQYELVSS